MSSRCLQDAFHARITVRGDTVRLEGDSIEVQSLTALFSDLIKLVEGGDVPDVDYVRHALDLMRSAEYSPTALREDVLLTYRGRAIRPKTSGQKRYVDAIRSNTLLTYRGRAIRPKTSGQKRYVDAIRSNTVTFGIGPAGTGKTYLAMAMAIAALKRKEVGRIILTRPIVEAGESLGFLPGTLTEKVTGKTYLAMAMAIAALKRKEVGRIILTRPIVEAGESLGFLPGTLTEKVDPYIRPLYDALYDMTDMERANQLLDNGTIEIAPLAFMRGRTLNDSFIILDEAQNTTAEQMKMFMERANQLLDNGTIEIAPLAFMRGRTLNDSFIILDEAQNTTAEQMKMFLTRLGFGSKMVITGDASQIDLPHGVSGLKDAQRVLSDLDDIEFCSFTGKDVVRHSLVATIVSAYERSGSPTFNRNQDTEGA